MTIIPFCMMAAAEVPGAVADAVTVRATGCSCMCHDARHWCDEINFKTAIVTRVVDDDDDRPLARPMLNKVPSSVKSDW
jgi:hypothetical protein